MSTHRHSAVRQEEDHVAVKPVMFALIAVTVIGCALVTWAWFALRSNERAHGLLRRPLEAVPTATSVMGGLYQTLINVDTTIKGFGRRSDERLTSWGWVDRERRIARIPIEAAIRAMTDTVQQ